MKYRHISIRECHKIMDWYRGKSRTLWCMKYPKVHWPENLDWCLLAQAELTFRNKFNRAKPVHTPRTLWQESELHKQDTVITDYNLVEWPSESFNQSPEQMYEWLLLNWVVHRRGRP